MNIGLQDIPMSRAEFVALMAMMFATIAFSIDAMLPALPLIASEITPDDPTRAPLILTFFVIGMGLGTFVAGPISDALGRRRTMFLGVGLYIGSAAVAWASQTLEVMLIARLCQGLGAAGPRVVCIAIIRDLFSGRDMARTLSIVMIIFTLVPAFAPAMGALIVAVSGWRAIFGAFVVFALICALWLAVRLPETLPKDQRRPLRLPLLWDAVRQMLTHRVVRLAILAQTLSLGMLYTTLMLVQPIYDKVFSKVETFPYWFGAVALVSASGSLLNATIVGRLGMRRLVTYALATQILMSTAFLTALTLTGTESFALFLIWQAYMFFQAGLTIGNLNAIAMEPMGHIAGMAASVIGAIATVLAACMASPIGLLFDGTTRPLVAAVLVLACGGVVTMIYMRRAEAQLLPA